jgi:4-oxalocrotonate tautomerase
MRIQAMPHITVKLWPGKSGPRSVTSVLGYGEDSVSVGFEEVAADAWMDEVYKPDIEDKWHSIVKKPGYGPLGGRS